MFLYVSDSIKLVKGDKKVLVGADPVRFYPVAVLSQVKACER